MKIFALAALFLFLSISSFCQDAKDSEQASNVPQVSGKSNLYKNGVGVRIGTLNIGGSYKHYFKNIIIEGAVGVGSYGFFGPYVVTNLLVAYQLNWKYWLQPYGGIGIRTTIIPSHRNIIGRSFSSNPNDDPIVPTHVFARPIVTVGAELFPPSWRISFFADATVGIPIFDAGTFFSVSAGFRYLFTKSNK